ncbi:isoprenyl transferase [Eubacteriales bacterium KG127]
MRQSANEVMNKEDNQSNKDLPICDVIPEHVAIIMDGNGRWAKAKGVPRILGHNAGMKSMIEATRAASDWGIKHLTVYAFSTENWKRSKEEVGGIFNLLIKFVDSELNELHRNNVKVNVIGDYKHIPKAALIKLEHTIDTTKFNTGLNLNIALNYGSRAEIVRAVKKLILDVKNQNMSDDEIDNFISEEAISRYLYTGNELGNIKEPDLIIRTSGEERLSNFLLWQAAYSEFAFTPVLWPDFTRDIFKNLIEEYGNRDRRFGGRK